MRSFRRRIPVQFSFDRGQILVMFAGGLVTLLLIGSLVIDLGFIFMTKRQEQNAADPGAVAAARYLRPSVDVSSMWTAACFFAVQNGFQPAPVGGTGPRPASCPGVSGAADSTLTVNWPPSAAAGAFAGKSGYVEVLVTRNHSSFLAGLVGLGVIPVTARAVAANDSGSAGAASLVALNPTQCSSAKISGGGSGGGINIFPAPSVAPGSGGFIQVDSSCGAGDAKATNDTCNDSNSQGAFFANGGTSVTAPSLYVVGACDNNGNSLDWHVGTTDEAAPYVGDSLSLIRPPSPTDLTVQQCGTGAPSTAANPQHCTLHGTVTLNPGTYYGGWQIGSSGAAVTLNPGIYVIAGGGISDTGGLLTSASGRVFIFSTDASSDWKAKCIAGQAGSQPDACQNILKMDGGSSLSLIGLDRSSPCPPYSASGCPFGGMLMWQDANGSAAVLGGQRCDISLGGSTNLYLSGTIYAACGSVTIAGNNSSTGCLTGSASQDCAAIQIVSDTFNIKGAAILQMPYDPSQFYHLTLKGLVR